MYLLIADMQSHPTMLVNMYCNFSVHCEQHTCLNYTQIENQKGQGSVISDLLIVSL